MPTTGEQNVLKLIKGWIVPFAGLFFGLATLAYITVSSLFRPLAWAMLLAFICYPSYRMVLAVVGKTRRNVGACLITFLVVALVMAPTLSAGVVASREALALFSKLSPLLGNFEPSKGLSLELLLPEVIVRELLPLFNHYPVLTDGVQQLLNWFTTTMLQLSRNFLGNTVTLIYHQIIIFITFFFLLRDGNVILDYIKAIIPLTSDERDEFMQRADVVLRAVVFGIIVTAGVQGLLGAFGWWFVGLSNPLLAGAIMALLAMIPFVGTPTVWVPGSVYLFLVGDIKGCIILLLWGICVVSTVDNFLRPYFISEKANMSTLLIFLGAFGGLASWGFIGVFMGPLILSLFVFFMDSYRRAWAIYQTSQAEEQEPEELPPSVYPSV